MSLKSFFKRNINELKPLIKNENKLKPKKNFGKVLAKLGTIALTSGLIFSTALSAQIKDKPSTKKIFENITTIEKLMPEESSKINTAYFNAVQHLKIDVLSNNISLNLAHLKNAKQINCNVFIDLSEENKEIFNYVAEYFNEINENLYTGIPKIVMNFSPTIFDKLNLYDIDICSKDKIDSFRTLSGQNLSIPVLTKNGFSTIQNKILLDNDCLSYDIYKLLSHELMHALYGIGDLYLADNSNKNVKSIMNHDNYISLNDLTLICATTWDKELTDEQKIHVSKYLEEKENGGAVVSTYSMQKRLKLFKEQITPVFIDEFIKNKRIQCKNEDNNIISGKIENIYELDDYVSSNGKRILRVINFNEKYYNDCTLFINEDANIEKSKVYQFDNFALTESGMFMFMYKGELFKINFNENNIVLIHNESYSKTEAEIIIEKFNELKHQKITEIDDNFLI